MARDRDREKLEVRSEKHLPQRWNFPRFRRLLEGEGEFDERWFGPGGADETDADREARDVAGGYRDAWVARDRRGGGARTEVVVPVHQVGRPRRSARERDEGDEPMLL